MKPEKPGDPTSEIHAARQRSGDVIDQVSITRARLVDKDVAAAYLGVSTNTIERLIQTGALLIVKFPVERSKPWVKGDGDDQVTGDGKVGTSRRVLIDVRDLNALIERSKERL